MNTTRFIPLAGPLEGGGHLAIFVCVGGPGGGGGQKNFFVCLWPISKWPITMHTDLSKSDIAGWLVKSCS